MQTILRVPREVLRLAFLRKLRTNILVFAVAAVAVFLVLRITHLGGAGLGATTSSVGILLAMIFADDLMLGIIIVRRVAFEYVFSEMDFKIVCRSNKVNTYFVRRAMPITYLFSQIRVSSISVDKQHVHMFLKVFEEVGSRSVNVDLLFYREDYQLLNSVLAAEGLSTPA